MKSVLIIGAGFSGTVTAVQLLRSDSPEKMRVILVNRSGGMARGIAYGTQSPHHMLNVPAGNMSALADDPDDFLRFCRQRDESIVSTSFVPRSMYGDYLESLLNEAEHRHPDGTLVRVVGEVTRIVPAARAESRRGATVSFADGKRLGVDRVVLAFGHYPSKNPRVSNPDFYGSKRYVRDPWAPSALSGIRSDDSVLLLGTGLTALDVSINLPDRTDGAVVYAASRRGLLPQPHRTDRGHAAHAAHVALPPLSEEGIATSVRKQLRAIRAHAAAFVKSGGDWREIIGALRPVTQTIWKRLPLSEKARFLRHVQAFWDTHRHRVAPEPYTRFQRAIAADTLKIFAGRIVSYEEDAQGVRVTLKPRGSHSTSALQVGWVVNCTGPGTDLREVDDALIRQMLGDGLIQADALGLGLEVAGDCAVIGADGQASDVLYYIGPLLKAHYWEATAVPELRVFARRLADTIIEGFGPGPSLA